LKPLVEMLALIGLVKLKNQTAPATPRSFFTAAGHMNDTDL
jgi:hypothetical protein